LDYFPLFSLNFLFQELQKPNEEDIKEITEKTRQALEKLTQSKVQAAMPVRCADKKVRT
jgi:SNW domain-containing protein 1